jgi:hypothetical protein
MKRIYCALAITAFILFVSCKKTVSELPVPTQTGANTFGCKVDGQFWVPAGFGIAPTAPILEARYMPGWDVIINARNFSSSPTESEFEIHLKSVKTTGVYLLNSNTQKYPYQTANYGYYVSRKINPLNEWITNTQYTGQVEITKTDTLNNIISGTFQFTAINLYNTPKPINITEGRFDVKMQ